MTNFARSVLNDVDVVSGSSKLRRVSAWSRLPFAEPHHEILDEDTFQKILCWERKRAERSCRRFLLMLVNMEALCMQKPEGRTAREIESILSQSTRETDATGWYSHRAILGVIFTELGHGSVEAFAELIRSRMSRSLEARIASAELSRIHFSFHCFPSRWSASGLGNSDAAQLYPDLFRQDRTRILLRSMKRAMDVFGSSVGLILCFPLLAVISSLIKLTSRGPVLFKQERIGYRGAPFTFLKFRSMKCGSDPAIHREYVKRFIAGELAVPIDRGKEAVYKIQRDPRVTRIGRFLRKTSLDELPQLFNVLRGDMSLVGPRPPIRYELESYQPWHRRRVIEVKPGITGLWQVSGRSRTTFDEMVRLDLRYARAWSPWLDVKILLRTPRAIFSGEGAY